MHLVLVRHAKSSWDDPDRPDIERPLNARGRRDGPRMARHLAAHLRPPERVLVSPARRTRETLDLLRQALAIAPSSVREEPRIYEADAAALVAVIRETPEDVSTLMLIGHNPGLTDCANLLAAGDPLGNVPTLGVVELECAGRRWNELAAGACRRTAFHRPKALAAGA